MIKVVGIMENARIAEHVDSILDYGKEGYQTIDSDLVLGYMMEAILVKETDTNFPHDELIQIISSTQDDTEEYMNYTVEAISNDHYLVTTPDNIQVEVLIEYLS